MATVQLFGYLGGNLNFKEPLARIQSNQHRSCINNTMEKSPKLTWGSPAIKDNNNSGFNQRSNNGDSYSVNPTQGSNNNEGASSVTRLPWGSPLSPVSTSFGPPISSSSPKSPYYSNDKRVYSGWNYAHDSGGPGGTQHPNSPRYSSPKSPFGGRGRSPFHSSQTHGSPSCKQNQSGSNSSSHSSSFFNTPKKTARNFHHDNTPYCSPNSSNISFNQSYTAEDYYKPSMLEDPWEKLRKRKKLS